MSRLQRLQVSIVVATTFAVLPINKASAAKKVTDPLERPSRDTETVYTDPSAADEDFQFVGEFRGFERTTGSARSSRSISLQVNAVGDGKFVATKMLGGTPEERTTEPLVVAMSGQRYGDRVEFDGGRFRYAIYADRAYVVDAEDIIIGKLERSGRVSPTMGRPAPPDAIVLFDNGQPNGLVNGRVTDDGLLKAGTQTADPWGDFQMHLEFRLPYKPKAFGQHRGNSGVYIQSRYEVQVLDSFGWIPAFNDCSSLYRTKRPDVNATLPPLTWQTYDIDFKAARFDTNGQRVQPAQLTVWLNGIKTHDRVSVPNKTGAGKPEGAEPLPIKFQEHKNPVVYRNMWILPAERRRGQFGPPSNEAVPPVPIDATPQWLGGPRALGSIQ